MAPGALQVAHYLAYATATHYGYTRHPAATSLGHRPPGPLPHERARELQQLQQLQQRARQEQYLQLQQQHEQRGGHETEAARGALQSDAHVHVDVHARLQPDQQQLMQGPERQRQRQQQQRGSRSQVDEEVEAVRREALMAGRMPARGLSEGHHNGKALHGVQGGGGQSPGYHDAGPTVSLSVSPSVSPSRASASCWGEGWLESCLGGALEGRRARELVGELENMVP